MANDSKTASGIKIGEPNGGHGDSDPQVSGAPEHLTAGEKELVEQWKNIH